MSLTSRILTAMGLGMLVGVMFNFASTQGWTAGVYDNWLNVFIIDGLFDIGGRIFVASLQLLVVPLVFVSLVSGVCALGDNSRMGPMAAKALALYMFTTAVAISLALLAGAIIQPGAGFNLESAAEFSAQATPSLKDVIINIFPTNPVKAMTEGNMLQIIVFSLLMGIAVARAGESGKKIAAFFNDFNDVIMKMVVILMNFAPYGVFCLLAGLFSKLGAEAFLNLAKYFFTVLAVLLVHAFGTLSLIHI